MRRRTLRPAWAALLVALIVFVPTSLAGAAGGGSVPAADAENGTSWFVELSGTPAAFRANAKQAGVSYSERFAFTKLWNGVSITTDRKNLAAIKELAGVKAVYPVMAVQLEPVANDS